MPRALCRFSQPCFGGIGFLFLFFFFALSSSPISAFAIPTLSPKLRDQEVRIGLFGNRYLTQSSETVADSATGNLALNLGARKVGNSGDFHFGIEGATLIGLRHAKYRYLDIGEAYAGYDSQKNWSIYAGRKRTDWSALDSYWSMGLFQPRFRWDYLNERENGLFGLFVGYQRPGLSVVGFGSPIFVPEQGAPFDIAGGACKSSSPWFSCPSSTILLFNQPTNIRFSLDLPPARKLVAHAGGGVTAKVGQETGPFLRLSYAHKPINQFLLSFEGRLDVVSQTVPAVIRPRVLYHDLYGTDLGWANDRHSVSASALREYPLRDYTPPTWNTQETTSAKLYGLTVKSMPFTNFLRRTRLEFAYLHRSGGIGPDHGPFVSPGVNTFEPRFAFQNAFSFAFFTPILDEWAQQFLFSTKFIADTLNDGNILVSDLYYSPISSLFLNLGLDILGSNNQSPVDFISRYQRNDRIRGGVAYVF